MSISSPGFYRPTWAEIDTEAFFKNASVLARRAGRARLLAVLKADAYGHGAVPLARILERRSPRGFWGFGVSSVEEGRTLREAGLKSRILILGSLFPFDSFDAALRYGLTPTVASRSSARALARAAARAGTRTPVHIKVDTGMGRIGMTPATAAEAIPDIAALPALRLEGVYTHLAQAENASRVREQLGLFDRLIHSLRGQGLSFLAHAANSEALLLRPESRYDMARPGLALYGVPPAPGVRGLVPVLTWKTRVVFLKDVSKGTRVSYGGTWRASRRSRLATLPVGYADGYRRALSNRGEVLVRGRRCPVVWRVTMDQIIVDVTDARGADIGEEVVLLGRQGRASVTAEDMAAWADTIPYEILCGLSARVPRVYS